MKAVEYKDLAKDNRVNLDVFETIVRNSNGKEDAFMKIHNIKNVPPAISDLFFYRYNRTGMLTIEKVFTNFYNKIKNNVEVY